MHNKEDLTIDNLDGLIKESGQLNRAQRRALKKKTKHIAQKVIDDATEINYMDMINKLKEMNAKQEALEDENTNQEN